MLMDEMAAEGDSITVSQACNWSGLGRRTFYYKSKQRQPVINEWLAAKIKRLIESLPYAGYRTVAFLLGENKNTVQRICQQQC